MKNVIYMEVYRDGTLQNTFYNYYDIARSLIDSLYMSKFGGKNHKLKENYNYSNKMIFTYTTYIYNSDETKTKYEYIYYNIPCSCNRLDTNKLLEVLSNAN